MDAFGLNALDGLDTHDTAQVRVLARKVEIAPTVGMTHQVHQRPEQHLVPPEPCLIAQHIAQLRGHVTTERCPYGRGRRHRGGFRLRKARPSAQPGAAIGHADAGDAELGDAQDEARDPFILAARRPVRSILQRSHVVRELLDLLLERHLCNQQVGALLRCEAVFIHGRPDAGGAWPIAACG